MHQFVCVNGCMCGVWWSGLSPGHENKHGLFVNAIGFVKTNSRWLSHSMLSLVTCCIINWTNSHGNSSSRFTLQPGLKENFFRAIWFESVKFRWLRSPCTQLAGGGEGCSIHNMNMMLHQVYDFLSTMKLEQDYTATMQCDDHQQHS